MPLMAQVLDRAMENDTIKLPIIGLKMLAYRFQFSAV